MTDPLAEAALLNEVLELYACGYGSVRISREMGGRVSHEEVQRMLRDAAAALRARNAEHIESAWMQQDLAIMRLYALCDEAIRTSLAFPEKAMKCAIMLMERRARLLGMDRERAPNRAGAFDWLDKAGPDELVRLAKSYGISVPTPLVA